jgi:serine/threonine-protein kinase
MNTDVVRKDFVGLVVDGRFTLLKRLGGSEQSSVYLCESAEDPSAKAAIKLISAELAEAESRSTGWNAAAELSHPHLMRLLHTGRCHVEDTEMVYVVTEYADEVLSEILPHRALTPPEAREMLSPVLDALSYLHERNLVHGDLKPANIMVVKDQLKLSVDTLFDLSVPGHHLPVPGAYDAPEWGSGTVSSAVDIWSLGATLVESLTQHPPAWSDESQTVAIILRSIPKPFAQIAEECLRPDPTHRCTLSEIKACLESGTAIPHRRGPKTEKAPAGMRRVAALVAALAVVLIVTVTLAVRSYKPGSSARASDQPPSRAMAPTPAPAPPPTQASAPISQPASQQSAPLPAATEQSPTLSFPAPAVAEVAPPPATPTAAPAPTQAPAQVAPAANLPAGNGGAKSGIEQQVLPDVPAKAIRTITGTVKVGIQVDVDPSGNVSDATIQAQGPSQYFANLALKAAKSWKFTPASADGEGAPSVWNLQFSFRKSGVEATASQEAH